MFLFYRTAKTCLGSLHSPTLQPAEPEDQFEQFEPVRESCDDPVCATNSFSSVHIKSSFNKITGSENPDASSLTPPRARSSTLLSSLSSPAKVGISGGDLGLRETPQALGSFRGGLGGRGSGARPSPASRLSFIDKKWLERCQVFGEMEADARPVAGNQEIVLDQMAKGQKGREMDRKIQEERVENDVLGAKSEATELGIEEEFKSIAGDKKVGDSVPKPSQQPTNKKEGEEEVNERRDEERGPRSSPTPEDKNEFDNKSRLTKKKGRKRQREGENMEGDVSEEGGVKKRQRNAKNKESSGVNLSPAPAERKKRRAKKKEDEEAKEEKDTKVPKKVNEFTFMSAHIVFIFFGGASEQNMTLFLSRFLRRTC